MRLTRLYTEPLEVEGAVLSGADGATEALAELERKVNAIRVPRAQVPLLFTLKQHLALVRERPTTPSSQSPQPVAGGSGTTGLQLGGRVFA